jgi:hypothetical protein
MLWGQGLVQTGVDEAYRDWSCCSIDARLVRRSPYWTASLLSTRRRATSQPTTREPSSELSEWLAAVDCTPIWPTNRKE